MTATKENFPLDMVQVHLDVQTCLKLDLPLLQVGHGVFETAFGECLLPCSGSQQLAVVWEHFAVLIEFDLDCI